MTEIERRVATAQATLDRFKDRPMRLGRNDCVRMAAFHLRKLGHRVVLPPSGAYASVRSGLRELEARGYKCLADALDSFGFARIAPAAAVPSDILMLPAVDRLGALVIALTPLLEDRVSHILGDLRRRNVDLVVLEISPAELVSPGPDDRDQLVHQLWRLQRDAVRTRLRGVGIPVATWRLGEPLEGPLEEMRLFKRQTRSLRA